MAGKCSECQEPIPSYVTAWWEVTGWEHERDQGGTNHIALRKRSGRVICPECMKKLQQGLSSAQMSLVDTPQAKPRRTAQPYDLWL